MGRNRHGFPGDHSVHGPCQERRSPTNSNVNFALIGCGDHSGYALSYKNYDKAMVVAVCDPIKARRLEPVQQSGNCAGYGDFREVLERKDGDSVHIATPDHWHMPISLLAGQAGKDMLQRWLDHSGQPNMPVACEAKGVMHREMRRPWTL